MHARSAMGAKIGPERFPGVVYPRTHSSAYCLSLNGMFQLTLKLLSPFYLGRLTNFTDQVKPAYRDLMFHA